VTTCMHVSERCCSRGSHHTDTCVYCRYVNSHFDRSSVCRSSFSYRHTEQTTNHKQTRKKEWTLHVVASRTPTRFGKPTFRWTPASTVAATAFSCAGSGSCSHSTTVLSTASASGTPTSAPTP
jgi:hypothetical protein